MKVKKHISRSLFFAITIKKLENAHLGKWAGTTRLIEHADRQAVRQAVGQKDMQKSKQADRYLDRCMDRQIDRDTDRHTDRQAGMHDSSQECEQTDSDRH